MKHGECVACGEKHPIARMYYVRKGIHCRTCVDLFMKDAHVPILPQELRPLVDPTICAGCEKDSAEEVAGVRLCSECAGRVRRPSIPFFVWAFWLTLLAAAGVAGLRASMWASSDADLDRARLAIEAGDASGAAKILDRQPPSEKLTLLLIRYDLIRDQFGDAHARSKTLSGRWVRGGLSQSIPDELARAERGAAQAVIARRLLDEGKLGPAYAAIHQARKDYPQSDRIRRMFLNIAGLYAFSKKEFETYIQAHLILGEGWPDDPDAQLACAAALAARWALSGDEASKKRALEILERFKAVAPAYESFVRRRIDGKTLEAFK